jgi:squalene cyclase
VRVKTLACAAPPRWRIGGAAHANVFTRTLLALYGEVPWNAVPVMPVEVMLDRITDHLEGEIRLDGRAHVERALVDEGPAVVQANVFTRTLLALYGEVPWNAVPVMPVEVMLLPRWTP